MSDLSDAIESTHVRVGVLALLTAGVAVFAFYVTGEWPAHYGGWEGVLFLLIGIANLGYYAIRGPTDRGADPD